MKIPENSGNKFSADRIVAVGGMLKAIISENSFTKEEMDLRHAMTIELAPISMGNELFYTDIKIYDIKLGVKSWKELPGRGFDFPKQPEEDSWKGEYYRVKDYVSGILRLFDINNPVSVTRIEFGRILNSTITVELEMEIDFRKAGFEPITINLDAELKIGEVAIHGDTTMIARPDIEQASEIARQFLNLADYYDPVFNGSVKYYPKID